jgi:hypothetical protein
VRTYLIMSDKRRMQESPIDEGAIVEVKKPRLDTALVTSTGTKQGPQVRIAVSIPACLAITDHSATKQLHINKKIRRRAQSAHLHC